MPPPKWYRCAARHEDGRIVAGITVRAGTKERAKVFAKLIAADQLRCSTYALTAHAKRFTGHEAKHIEHTHRLGSVLYIATLSEGEHQWLIDSSDDSSPTTPAASGSSESSTTTTKEP